MENLLSFIKSQNNNDEDPATANPDKSDFEELKQKYTLLKKEQEDALKLLEEEMEAAGERVKTIKTQERKKRIPEVTLRREFRIIGQIGEAGQREKLSY